MQTDFKMPVMAKGTAVCYTVSHDDLLEFAREVLERTKEMSEVEKTKTETPASNVYYSRKEVMALVKRCNSTMTKWAHAGYLVPIRIGGKFLYRKEDVERILGLNH